MAAATAATGPLVRDATQPLVTDRKVRRLTRVHG